MNVPEFRNDVNFRGEVEANDVHAQNGVTFEDLYEDEEFCSFLRKLQCIASANGDTNVIDSLCRIANQYEACFAADWDDVNNLGKEVLNSLTIYDIYVYQYLDYVHNITDKDGKHHLIWKPAAGEDQNRPMSPWIRNFLLDMKYCREVHKKFKALIKHGNYEGYKQEFTKWKEQTRGGDVGFIPIGKWPKIVNLIPEEHRRKE